MRNAPRFAAAILGLLVCGAATAGAATFTPTTTADGFDGACDAHCTLREAIAAANGLSGPDEVRLGPGIYQLTRAGDREDAGATGDLDVTDDLTLTGAGAASTTIDGGGIDRILDVHFLNSGDVAIADLTLRNGHAREPSGDGGAISSQSRLTITRCHIAVNVADAAGGGIFLLFGDLVIRDSTISGNTAATAGGGIASSRGRMELVNVTISGNRAMQAGGGIAGESFSPGFGTLTSSTITDNLAPQGGGIIAFPAVPETTDPDPELEHTIVAGNSSLQTPECSLVLDANHNLLALLGVDGSCPSPGPTAFDLKLAPLGLYGGPTPTHALLAGSPAIDAGLPAPGAGSCAATDQRGRARPADGDGNGTVRCDVGAFERDASCATEGGTLCLGGRFLATARWTTPQGTSGAGQAVSLTSDTGHFWFFDPANVEVVVKALDACRDFDRFWIFAAGLTNVEVELTVEDTESGQIKTYRNPQGRPFQPILDTDAFETCP